MISLRNSAALAGALVVAIATSAAAAAQTPARPTPAPPAQPPQIVPTPPVDEQDARDTRERLRNVLERHPPALARVLKLDPSLLNSQEYLAAYPAFAAFLAQHPEIARNPGYFLAFVPGQGDSWGPMDRESQALGMWRDLISGVGVLIMFATVTLTLGWLVKSLIDYRRWQKLQKVQVDAHTKILDRFASNEDLLAYIQTPPGRRFLESAPIALDAPGAMSRSIGAPLGRILWSVQAGIVIAAAGLGLLFVSTRVIEEVSQALLSLGVLAVAVGGGFVASAVVSYVLSRRLGLVETPAAVPAAGREA